MGCCTSNSIFELEEQIREIVKSLKITNVTVNELNEFIQIIMTKI